MKQFFISLKTFYYINRSFSIDTFLLLTLSAVTVYLTFYFELFEIILDFSRTHEDMELDEIILSLSFISFYLLIFTVRRLLDIRKLQKKADTDSLVNIFNRRKGIELIYSQLHRNTNSAQASLFMFDIDHFKKINDKYGHNIGDYVLIEIISILQKQSRFTDIFIRWGGKSFSSCV